MRNYELTPGWSKSWIKLARTNESYSNSDNTFLAKFIIKYEALFTNITCISYINRV
jgi:hypothetical protein